LAKWDSFSFFPHDRCKIATRACRHTKRAGSAKTAQADKWAATTFGKCSEHIRFSSAVLPPYTRRPKSLEVLIPILYLQPVSSGDFEEGLVALLGKDTGGLSASTISRLKEAWSDEHAIAAFDASIKTWGVKYDKAVECLVKDRDALLAFYDFPAEHWKRVCERPTSSKARSPPSACALEVSSCVPRVS
jgi:hypothetical protein